MSRVCRDRRVACAGDYARANKTLPNRRGRRRFQSEKDFTFPPRARWKRLSVIIVSKRVPRKRPCRVMTVRTTAVVIAGLNAKSVCVCRESSVNAAVSPETHGSG